MVNVPLGPFCELPNHHAPKFSWDVSQVIGVCFLGSETFGISTEDGFACIGGKYEPDFGLGFRRTLIRAMG
jgi:hypothetical protein